MGPWSDCGGNAKTFITILSNIFYMKTGGQSELTKISNIVWIPTAVEVTNIYIIMSQWIFIKVSTLCAQAHFLFRLKLLEAKDQISFICKCHLLETYAPKLWQCKRNSSFSKPFSHHGLHGDGPVGAAPI